MVEHRMSGFCGDQAGDMTATAWRSDRTRGHASDGHRDHLVRQPSSGGANGVPYLPTFWRDIGPFLPPRNAYILLHQTIYFSGHGTTEALTILLVYLGVTLVILGLLDWSGTERPVNPDIAEAAALAVPAGAAP